MLGELKAALVLQEKTAIGMPQIPKTACDSHSQVEEAGQRQISGDAPAYPGSAIPLKGPKHGPEGNSEVIETMGWELDREEVKGPTEVLPGLEDQVEPQPTWVKHSAECWSEPRWGH